MQMSRPKILVGSCFLAWWLHGMVYTPPAEAQVAHSIPRDRLRRRTVPTTPTPTANNNVARQTRPAFVPAYDWEKQEYVRVHNDLRRTVGMHPLRWDLKLASNAHSCATARRRDCNYRHHSKEPYGENTFWMQYKEFTPSDVVRRWFREQSFFDHLTNRCKCQPETEGCECGHYINVIWKTTARVGCSSPVYCSQGKGLLVVCSYDPPGNYLGMNPLNPTP